MLDLFNICSKKNLTFFEMEKRLETLPFFSNLLDYEKSHFNFRPTDSFRLLSTGTEAF